MVILSSIIFFLECVPRFFEPFLVDIQLVVHIKLWVHNIITL